MPLDPADLRILRFPAPQLRFKTAPIQTIDQDVRAVAARMIELMHEANGVGLAAPQVGLKWRMFVTHTPDDQPRVYINPTVQPLGEQRSIYEEGCLSLPGIHVEIERPVAARIAALDVEGQPFSNSSDGFPARVWQHELDHLNGVLIIDRMSQLDRLATRKALKELSQPSAARGDRL